MKCFLVLFALCCCAGEYKKVPLVPYCTPSRVSVLTANPRTGHVFVRVVDLNKVYILVPKEKTKEIHLMKTKEK